MKTKAAILYELNKPLRVEEVEIPSLKPGQVLVQILFSGLCRAQYNEMIGLKGPDKFLPHMLGHEASAIVGEIGCEVTKVRVGDYVALSWIKGDGCEVSQTFYQNGAQRINAGAVTTFSHYSVVSENRLTKIPKNIPADLAAILGCAVITGCGIIHNTLNPKEGSSIAIFGTGGVGACVVMAAKEKGCFPIIAVDLNEKKLEFAQSLGATHGLLMSEEIVERIRRVVPVGLDYAVDASGAKMAMESAFEVLHDKGVLVIAGNLSKEEKISIHPFDLIKGKKIIGSWGGESVPQRDITRCIRAYRNGKLPYQKLITHRFGLEDINRAFQVLSQGEAGRILIEMK